jgi:hypothetical protein
VLYNRRNGQFFAPLQDAAHCNEGRIVRYLKEVRGSPRHPFTLKNSQPTAEALPDYNRATAALAPDY